MKKIYMIGTMASIEEKRRTMLFTGTRPCLRVIKNVRNKPTISHTKGAFSVAISAANEVKKKESVKRKNEDFRFFRSQLLKKVKLTNDNISRKNNLYQ